MIKKEITKITLENEEEVKNKVIEPYLKALGLNLEDVQYETTLKLKLGKTTHDKKSTNVRLDILCKKGDKNLFVFELKRDSKQIDQEDIDQGISYARLIHPMAPFMIVSNGKDTRIFDTITKKQLDNEKITKNEFIKKDFHISIQDDISLRYEALECFIGYSNKNLKIFSNSQNKNELFSLLGSKEESSKKYIPELFTKRLDLEKTFKEFQRSNNNIFLISGESGVGKTNSICNLIEKLAETNLTLFYKGSFLSKPLFERINEDFNRFFSSNLNKFELFKRLDNLAKKTDKKLYIFIDAIDEIPFENRAIEINDICTILEEFENINLCMTCKTNSLYEFKQIHGQDTKFTEETKKNSFTLKRFTLNELDEIVLKYKNFFNLNGIFSEELKKYCGLGFQLKIITELFCNKTVPHHINVDYITRKYMKSKAINADIKEIELEKVFSKIGELMCTGKGKVMETALSEVIGKDINENFFTYNILERRKDEYGRSCISFYNAKLSDFVISLYSYKLDTLSKKELEEVINKIKLTTYGINSLLWFNGYATEDQKKVFVDIKKKEGLAFLSRYEKILNSYFPKIKNKFEPFTKNEIGLAIDSIESPFIHAYGFYKKTKIKNKIILIDSITSDKWFEQGVMIIYDTLIGINAEANKFSTNKIISKQLEKIIKNSDLNEEENINLSKEKLINLVYFYGKKIGYNHKINNNLLDYNVILPLDLNKLEYNVKYNIFQEYYKNQQRTEYIKIKMSEGIHTFNEEGIFDYKDIELKTKEALSNNCEIPQNLKSINLLIFNEINILKNKSIQTINEAILPLSDISEENAIKSVINNKLEYTSFNIRFHSYSKEKNKKYFYDLFHLYFKEYLILVENNFPFLKNYPYKILFKLNKNQRDIIYHYLRDKNENEEIIIEHEFKEKFNASFIQQLKEQDFSELGRLEHFCDSPYFKIGKKTGNADRHSIIRGLVYKQILEDFNSIKNIFENDIFDL